MTHYVVCGYPRSGSTLLYNMLRSTVMEYDFYDKEVRAASVIDDVAKVTKNPKDACDFRELQKPGCRFIVTIRDPRAVLTSRHAKSGDDYFINWRRTEPGGRTGHKQRPGLLERDRCVRELVAEADHILIRYERLIADPDEVQHQLADWAWFRYSGHFADFHRYDVPNRLEHQLNGVRPVEASRIDAWRQHPDRIRQQFTECPDLFELVRFWGYEANDRWFDALAS